MLGSEAAAMPGANIFRCDPGERLGDAAGGAAQPVLRAVEPLIESHPVDGAWRCQRGLESGDAGLDVMGHVFVVIGGLAKDFGEELQRGAETAGGSLPAQPGVIVLRRAVQRRSFGFQQLSDVPVRVGERALVDGVQRDGCHAVEPRRLGGERYGHLHVEGGHMLARQIEEPRREAIAEHPDLGFWVDPRARRRDDGAAHRLSPLR